MVAKENIKISLLKESEIDDVVLFYNGIYKTDRDRKKFIWEFYDAPAGKSIYVIARDMTSNKIIGTQCAIPIELVLSDGRSILTAKSEDTLVDPEYRGLNIFENMYKLLFEACIRTGIRYIWGLTTAQKPFLRLGFEIPFEHSQSLRVFKTKKAFKYLSELSTNNDMITLIKIFGLCVLARLAGLKALFNSKKDFRIELKCIPEGKSDIHDNSELLANTLNNGFSIKQDMEFLRWRISINPYYTEVLCFNFLWRSKRVGSVIFNHHKNGAWYLLSDLYASQMDRKEKGTILNEAVVKLNEIAKNGVALIRTWDFDHNEYGKQEMQIRTRVGFISLKRGISFVWKSLDKTSELDAKDFVLSRLASQGVM